MQVTTKDGRDLVEGIDSFTPEELFREGSQYFRAKDFARARECFERYMELVPSDAEACHLLARVYYHENDNLDKATACLRNAVSLDPDGASRFYQTMAEIYIHLGEFGRAEDVLDEARSKDPGDDPRHTYAIDFYLNLVRKRNKGRKGKAGDGGKEPEYYSARRDERYNREGRHLFLLPSILVHVLMLFFLGYLSGMNIHLKKDTTVDFTYVNVDVIGEGEPQQGAAEGPAGAEAREGTPDTGPARGPVETAAPGRQSAKAGIEGQAPEFEAEGPRSLSAEKTAAGLEAPESEVADVNAPTGAEKRLDVTARAREMQEDLVNFRPGKLDFGAEADTGSERAEARTGTMSDRRDTATARVTGAPEVKAGGEQRASVAGAKAQASLSRAQSREQAPAPTSRAEKAVTVDKPSKSRPDELMAEAGLSRSAPDRLNIGVSGAESAAAESRSKAESVGTVARGAERAAPAAAEPGAESVSSGARRLTTSREKTATLTGQAGAMSEAPALTARAERASAIKTARPGKRVSGPESLPAPRNLGISVGETGAADATARRAVTGAPSGISDRASAAAPAAAVRPTDAGVEIGGSSRGYSAAGSGRGKGVEAGALSGDSSDAAVTGIRTAGRKSGVTVGGHSPTGMMSPAGTGSVRAGGLEGLVKETPGGTGGTGKGGAPGGTGGKPGVRLGSGEKSGTAAPDGKGVAGLPDGSGKDGAASLEKRDAQGALGVPGGKGQERYAAVAKARTGQLAPEKKAGVQVASKTGPKGVFGLTVKILTPAPGKTRELTQVVSGIVSDPRMVKATLSVNNDSRVVSVESGRFEAAVALNEGRNIITVMAFDKDGNAGKDSVIVEYSRSAGPIQVSITEPRDGQVFDVSQNNTIKVRGLIGDPNLKRATMILNGRPKDITVTQGRFNQEVALTQENNTVSVEVEDEDGAFSTSQPVSFATMNVKPKDIMVILTWDKPNADFDLHVFGPLGGHCYYRNPNIYESNEAISGAQLEQDAKGNFGPEIFTMESSEKGIYTIKSNYYYSGGDGDASATVTVILYGDNPARRIVRVFGPHLQVDTKTGEEMWDVARFRMPEGIFLEE